MTLTLADRLRIVAFEALLYGFPAWMVRALYDAAHRLSAVASAGWPAYRDAMWSAMTPERLAELEECRGAAPTLAEIEAIAKALGVPVWRLFQMAEELSANAERPDADRTNP